jgi:hypothetical protein
MLGKTWQLFSRFYHVMWGKSSLIARVTSIMWALGAVATAPQRAEREHMQSSTWGLNPIPGIPRLVWCGVKAGASGVGQASTSGAVRQSSRLRNVHELELPFPPSPY